MVFLAMASLRSKKTFSTGEVAVLAIVCLGCLWLFLWMFHFRSLNKIYELPRLAGESSTEVKAKFGEPYEILTEKEHNDAVDSLKDSLNPDPKPQLGIDEAWKYYIGNNYYTILYFKDDKVIRIYLGAT